MNAAGRQQQKQQQKKEAEIWRQMRMKIKKEENKEWKQNIPMRRRICFLFYVFSLVLLYFYIEGLLASKENYTFLNIYLQWREKTQ